MGFMQGNVARNAFRFIQKTKQIQDHRGDKVDDGLVRVEFAFEKPKPEIVTKTIIHEVHNYPYFKYPYVWYDHSSPSWHYTYGSTSQPVGEVSSRGMSGGASGQMVGEVSNSCYNVNVENLSYQPNKDEGITVKGSEVYQAFNYTSIGELEQAEVIIIQLKGSGDTGVMVEKPITVQSKLVCKTCGSTSPSNNKYCPNCGTYLLS
jgi:ribosomal protein L40E